MDVGQRRQKAVLEVARGHREGAQGRKGPVHQKAPVALVAHDVAQEPLTVEEERPIGVEEVHEGDAVDGDGEVEGIGLAEAIGFRQLD